ncbi:formimidoylglutamate deiminase [Kineobactrum salinum]|uniref:Formimidoylglutamate deiminase n=1 Tax=Kineobactrum salinum TaxID=2708301 RepID=A0A6C0U518_9GAMM|nr:formimidoylglutamate deiminase [Kineobactrum salinum]QIB67086.1 formimidoylglutamate deiminase [Kineobactrum salinum]
MTILWAKQALTAEGWQSDVRVEIAPDGRIAAVSGGAARCGLQLATLLPAPVNLHSHGFQRALAGLAEGRGPTTGDSFWTWRQLMYRFLERLTPEAVEAITAFAQLEMLEAGFAAVAEFHYLHHQADGSGYRQPAAMARRVVAAAQSSGIGLTLLPVLYQYGGCDRRPLGPGQARFGNSLEGFARLHEDAALALRALPADARLGLAPHSLRAVDPEGLAEVLTLAGDGPVHIHVAEQAAEVADVQAALGARPVEWLLANAGVGPRWCLVHCTHMLPQETVALARSGAVAGVCPITEANLGDGIFDAVRYLEAGGQLGVGSDSNVRISLLEELRLLEYSQRLRDGSRAALATAQLSTGRRLFGLVCRGGALAAGRDSGEIAVGKWADLLALREDTPDQLIARGDTCLDSLVFTGDNRSICDVWSAGRHLVRDGRHCRRDAILRAYAGTLRQLKESL